MTTASTHIALVDSVSATLLAPYIFAGTSLFAPGGRSNASGTGPLAVSIRLIVVVRPDGSEPEITAYLEVVAPVPAGGLQYARDNAANRMAALSQAVRTLLDS